MKALTNLLITTLVFSTHVIFGQWQALDVFDNGYATHLTANEDYLFAATKGGIFRTSNPEMGWEKINGDEIHDHWKVHVFDDIVFSLIHLQRATNNGDDDFEMVIWQDDYPYDFRFMDQKGDTLIAKRFNGSTIFTSTDMGGSWTPMEQYPSAMRKIVSDEDYFYLIQAHAFQRTHDFTEIELLSSDFPVDDFNEEWQDALVTDNSILILQETGTILYSDDQGSNWEYAQVPVELGNNIVITDWDHYNNIVAASVSFPENGVLRSTNSGQSWEFYPSPQPYHFESVAFFQSELYAAPEFSGVQKVEFSNEELELTPVGSGITVASADDIARSGDHIYIHRKYDNIYESQTQLGTVSPVSGLPPIDWEADEVSFARHCMVGAQINTGIEETPYFYKIHIDNAWNELPADEPFLDNDIIAFDKEGDTIVIQSMYSIHYSVNGGETWNTLLNIIPPGIEGAVLYNNGRLFFNDVLDGPGFTEDFGQNLEFPDVGLGSILDPNPAHTLFSYGESLLFISYNERAISHNNGDTWTTLDNPSRFEVAYARDSIVVAAWRGRDVYVSSDFGESFEIVDQDNSGLPMYATYNNVYFDNNRIYLSVKNGNIYYTSPIELGLMPFTGVDEQAIDYRLVYPNPAVEMVWFEPFQESVELSIYTTQGQQIDEIILQPNSNSLKVDHLPKGMFLLRFRNLAGGEISRSKLLIQR